jgi:hypothetical protein
MPTSARRSDSGPRRKERAVAVAASASSEARADASPPTVCEHLLPLLQRLVHAYGLRLVERAEGLGCGRGYLFDAALPLEELAALPRPEFVHVIESRGLVFCERCWQSLGEWKAQKDAWN